MKYQALSDIFFEVNTCEKEFGKKIVGCSQPISHSNPMLEILYFIGIVLAGCPLILNTAQDCRLQAYAASSTYCRQFGISGPAHRDCQGNARG